MLKYTTLLKKDKAFRRVILASILFTSLVQYISYISLQTVSVVVPLSPIIAGERITPDIYFKTVQVPKRLVKDSSIYFHSTDEVEEKLFNYSSVSLKSGEFIPKDAFEIPSEKFSN